MFYVVSRITINDDQVVRNNKFGYDARKHLGFSETKALPVSSEGKVLEKMPQYIFYTEPLHSYCVHGDILGC